jgi:hypothetical protein
MIAPSTRFAPAPAITNKDPAALMSRQMGWWFLKCEGGEENGRFQPASLHTSG